MFGLHGLLPPRCLDCMRPGIPHLVILISFSLNATDQADVPLWREVCGCLCPWMGEAGFSNAITSAVCHDGLAASELVELLSLSYDQQEEFFSEFNFPVEDLSRLRSSSWSHGCPCDDGAQQVSASESCNLPSDSQQSLLQIHNAGPAVPARLDEACGCGGEQHLSASELAFLRSLSSADLEELAALSLGDGAAARDASSVSPEALCSSRGESLLLLREALLELGFRPSPPPAPTPSTVRSPEVDAGHGGSRRPDLGGARAGGGAREGRRSMQAPELEEWRRCMEEVAAEGTGALGRILAEGGCGIRADGRGFLRTLVEYGEAQRRARSAARLCDSSDGDDAARSGRCLRALVYRCGEYPCGGYSDRMRGLLSAFVLAVFAGRSFFVEYARPRRLDQLLAPNAIDWTTDDVEALRHRDALLRTAQRVEHRAIAYMDPTSAIPDAVLPQALGWDVAVVVVQTNADLWDTHCDPTAAPTVVDPALCARVPSFRAFARSSGLRDLRPSPKPYCYSFLFAHSASLRRFFDAHAPSLPAAVLPRLSSVAPPLEAGPAVIALQLRTAPAHWRETSLWMRESDSARVAEALRCAAQLAGVLGVDPREAYVLVVTAAPRLLRSAQELAAETGLEPGRVFGAAPALVEHIDKLEDMDGVSAARRAEAMAWVVYESVLLSRGSAVVWSSGFGKTASDYGGVPPEHVAQLGKC